MTDSVHNRFEGSAQLVAQGENIEISVIHPRDPVSDAADRLALRVGAQWQDEANVRGLTGPGRLAVRWEARWAPTADHTEVRPDRLGLDELIARLPGPARLVVTGPGGAGKSSLAVLLVLGMLERRGPGDAVPVVLSLSGWEPEKHSLDDWIVQRVTEDYGDLVPGSAAGIVEALVQSRKIVPLLDGLDELVPPARADVVVTALKRSRASTGSPLVLLSRPEAFKAAAAEESFLRAMPVLRACPVTPQDGRDYLARECDPERLARWQPVFAELLGNPGGPLARALSSPLMLWLASTVYARGAAGPEELLDSGRLPTRAHIEDHLLDGLVPAVFSRGPAPRHIPGGVRPWGEKRALGYLRFLASLLDRGRTQDIAWWQILAAPTRPVVWGAVVLVAVALVGTGAAYAAAALLSLGESSTRAPFTTAAEALAASAGLSTVATVVGAVTAKHLFPGQGERPRRPVRTGSRFLPALPAVTAVLAVAGSVTPSGAPAILAAFFLPVLADVLLTRPADSDTALRPRLLLDDERRIASARAVILAPVVAGLCVGFFRWFDGRPLPAVAALAVAWSCSALALAALSRWGRWTATRLVLACRRRLPTDTIGFLEDAHRLGVLRQVGGVYQFRHAGLRRRLAGASPDRAAGTADRPGAVRLRSSATSLRALRLLGFDLVMPVVAYLVVVAPLSSATGFRNDWHQTWDLLVRDRLVLAVLVALLLLAALGLCAAGTELRVDADAVELNRSRRLRLSWEDVTGVQVRKAPAPTGMGALLPAQYHLAVLPRPGLVGPKYRTDRDGWIRVWDLGPTGSVPLALEVALSHFAGGRWGSTP